MRVRAATPSDATAMSDLLNEVIAAGGTTALERPTSGGDIAAKMARYATRNAWHVACAVDGTLLGFQWVAPNPDLPDDALDVATFARVHGTRRGVGTALFKATRAAAQKLGAGWINASIRSDNAAGLNYYARMGFVTYSHDPSAALSDGTITGKTYMRFAL